MTAVVNSADSWFDEWVAEPSRHGFVPLNAACSEEQIRAREAALGTRLGTQMRRFFSVTNGIEGSGGGPIPDFEIWSLPRLELSNYAASQRLIRFADYLFCALEYGEDVATGGIFVCSSNAPIRVAENFAQFLLLYVKGSNELLWDGISQWEASSRSPFPSGRLHGSMSRGRRTLLSQRIGIA